MHLGDEKENDMRRALLLMASMCLAAVVLAVGAAVGGGGLTVPIARFLMSPPTTSAECSPTLVSCNGAGAPAIYDFGVVRVSKQLPT